MDAKRITRRRDQSLSRSLAVVAMPRSLKTTRRCWKDATVPVLPNRTLGAETDTDIPQVEAETLMAPYHAPEDAERIVPSLGHALRPLNAPNAHYCASHSPIWCKVVKIGGRQNERETAG